VNSVAADEEAGLARRVPQGAKRTIATAMIDRVVAEYGRVLGIPLP
jgi:hypothetical protein